MTPDKQQLIDAALDRCLDLNDGERTLYLDQLAREHPHIHDKVQSILRDLDTARLNAPPSQLWDGALDDDAAGQNSVTPTRTPDPKVSLTDSATTAEEMPFTAAKKPERAGRYHIEEEIAHGGMGAVFRAVDPDLGRTLAVKILLTKALKNSSAIARFHNEAKFTSQLQHPGIPPVHEIGQLDDGRPFFAMKLIKGQTLAEMLKTEGSRRGAEDAENKKDSSAPATSAPLRDKLPRYIAIFEQICQTVAFAHSQGIIHRDLKPHNVMVGAFGEVQVMDWGLAKRMKDESGRMKDEGGSSFILHPSSLQTRAGDVMGTPAFMAPEQARGDVNELDVRCDVFGLGGILCIILTGKPPFQSNSLDDWRRDVTAGNLDDAFGRLNQCGADQPLIDLAKKCLHPEKEQRYRNAGEVAEAVGGYLRDVREKLRQVEVEREKAQVQVVEERRRRHVTAGLGVALLALVLGAAGAALVYQQYLSQQHYRKERLNSDITTALDAAKREQRELHRRLRNRREVRKLANDFQLWRAELSKAKAHWQEANKLASNNPAMVNRDVRERLLAVQKELKSDTDDREIAMHFNSLRLQAARSTHQAPTLRHSAPENSKRFAEEFAKLNLDVANGQTSTIGDRIRKSPLCNIYVDMLDHWAETEMLKENADEELTARLLEICRRVDPGPWRDQFRQIETWTNREKIKALADSVNFSEQSPHLLTAMASRLHFSRGDAYTFLRKAVLHHQDDFWFHFHLAKLSSTFDEKIGWYRAALAVRTDSDVVWHNLGDLLEKKWDLEGAVAHYEKALAINPQSAYSMFNLGNARRKQGDMKQAVVLYRKAVAVDASLPKVWTNMGNALRLQGNYSEATAALHRARQLRSQRKESTKSLDMLLLICKRIRQLQNTETQRVKDINLDKGIKGKLDKNNPLDVHELTLKSYRRAYGVKLHKGNDYQVDVDGSFDSFLRIESADYRPLRYNDDRNGGNLNSRLIFSPPQDGVYRIVVTSYQPQATGDFELKLHEVTGGKKQKLTGNLSKSPEFHNGKRYLFQQIAVSADVAYRIQVTSSTFQPTVFIDNPNKKNRNGKYSLGAIADTPITGKVNVTTVDFTPPTKGIYRVVITTANPPAMGECTMSVQSFRKVRH